MKDLKSIIKFEDNNLKLAILEKLNKISNEEVTIEEMQRINDFIVLDGCNITSLVGLEHATNVKRLNISNNNIESLEPIKDLVNIKSLFMQNTGISDLSLLSNLNLESLWCENNPISSLKGLEGSINLQSLNVFDCNNLLDLEPIRDFTNLETLDIRGTKVSSIEPVSKSVNMKFFYAGDCNIKDINIITNFTKLENIMIFNAGITDNELPMFLGFPNLTILRLDKNNISDISGLASLKDKLSLLTITKQVVTLDEITTNNEKVEIELSAKDFNGQLLEPTKISENGILEGTKVKWINIEKDSILTYNFEDGKFSGTINVPVKVHLSNIIDGDSDCDNIVSEGETLTNIVKVELTDNMSISISETNNAYACGSNRYGQLGIGKTTTEVLEPTRVQLRYIKEVITSGLHTFFITEDGIYACGKNYQGQLGLGHYKDVYTPEKINIEGVKEIVCSEYNTFFIMEDGTVKCCGTNACGELGLGHRSSVATIETIKELSNIKAIKTYSRTTLFETEDGFVYGCGDNRYGVLGTGYSMTTEQTTPIKIRIKKK